MREFDVVVSGGGLVGCATALALHQQGFSTLLLEFGTQRQQLGQFNHDLQTLALSPASCNWLSELGLSDAVTSAKIRQMFVWERWGTGHVEFNAGEVGCDYLAKTFEHTSLYQQLHHECQRAFTVHYDSTIRKIHPTEQTVTINDGSSIRCKLLVVAEGAHSKTRKLLNVPWDIDDQQQRAVVSLVKTESVHNNVAYQKFTNGICALLPTRIPDVMALIWSVPTTQAEQLCVLDTIQFRSRLNSSLDNIDCEVIEVDERLSFPLTQSLAQTFNPRDWIALVGDTAHTVHPLAGQGVNLGLEDARSLVHHVVSISNPSSFKRALSKYASHRQVKAKIMQQAMKFFKQTWSWSNPYTRWVRNQGVRAFNDLPILKSQVMREAMGVGPVANLR